MKNFKAGDKVKRVDGLRFLNGDVVNTIGRRGGSVGEVWLQESRTWLFEIDLMLVKEYPNPPHKHRDLIIEWANGADIQVRAGNDWLNVALPDWYETRKYRVKPQKSERDIEIENIQNQMDELKERLEKLKELDK